MHCISCWQFENTDEDKSKKYNIDCTYGADLYLRYSTRNIQNSGS